MFTFHYIICVKDAIVGDEIRDPHGLVVYTPGGCGIKQTPC
jgi:hypothetical protein